MKIFENNMLSMLHQAYFQNRSLYLQQLSQIYKKKSLSNYNSKIFFENHNNSFLLSKYSNNTKIYMTINL